MAEGVTAITRLLASGHRLRSVLVTPQALARFDGALDAVDGTVYVAPKDVLATTVGFDLHRGAVAAADRRPLPPLADVVAGASTHRRARGPQRPREPRRHRPLGAGVRHRGLVLDPTCIDPYYRRTIRVSMGEVLLLPVARAARWPDDLGVLRAGGIETWALTPDRRPSRSGRWNRRRGSRCCSAPRARACQRPRAPSPTARCGSRSHAGVDSLNVGHAAAVAFAHLARDGR